MFPTLLYFCLIVVASVLPNNKETCEMVCKSPSKTPDYAKHLYDFSKGGTSFYGLGKRSNMDDESIPHDLKAAQGFERELYSLFSSLLKSAGTLPRSSDNLKSESANLEFVYHTLSSKYSSMISSGNVYWVQIAEQFDMVRSLVELVQYREALHCKYGTDFNATDTQKERAEVGEIGKQILEVMNMGLSLFQLSPELLTDDKFDSKDNWGLSDLQSVKIMAKLKVLIAEMSPQRESTSD